MKWSVVSMALLALCVGAASAKAEDAVPVAALQQPVNMTGSWHWERPIGLVTPNGRPVGGVPTCDLVQTGNKLNGECTLNWAGKGPVTGTVDGDRVTLRWNFEFYEFLLTRPEVGGIYDDRHADVTFRGRFNAHHILHGRYRSDNQFGWNRVFFARPDHPGPTRARF
jgi:hypothetical protein